MVAPTFAPGTLFSRIFQASPVAMTVNALPDGRYIDVNDSFTQLVGYARDELIGRRAVDLDAGAGHTHAAAQPVLRRQSHRQRRG